MGASQACSRLQPPVRVVPVLHTTDQKELVYSVVTHAGYETSYPFWFEFTEGGGEGGGRSFCHQFATLFTALHQKGSMGGGAGEQLKKAIGKHLKMGAAETGEKEEEGKHFPIATVGVEPTPELEKKLVGSALRGVRLLDVQITKKGVKGTDVLVHLAMPKLMVLALLLAVKGLSDNTHPITRRLKEDPQLKTMLRSVRVDPQFKERFTLVASEQPLGMLPSSGGRVAVEETDNRFAESLLLYGVNIGGLHLDSNVLRNLTQAQGMMGGSGTSSSSALLGQEAGGGGGGETTSASEQMLTPM